MNLSNNQQYQFDNDHLDNQNDIDNNIIHHLMIIDRYLENYNITQVYHGLTSVLQNEQNIL